MEKGSNTSDRELLLTRTLNAPIKLVWEVWTKPEHLANWWGPNGFTNTISDMVVTPGGAFNLTMHGPDGTDYDNQSTYREVVPLEKLVFEHMTYPHIIFTINFEAQGDKTLLRWHMLFDSAEILADVAVKHGAKEGQKQNVEKLIHYLETINHVS
jgi:uncharacterized protein YndB with AHSA1/START domain